MDQIAQQLSMQAQGTLQSAIAKNPRQHTDVSVVVTKNGKVALKFRRKNSRRRSLYLR